MRPPSLTNLRVKCKNLADVDRDAGTRAWLARFSSNSVDGIPLSRSLRSYYTRSVN